MADQPVLLRSYEIEALPPLPFDVCDYPRIGKRRYRIDGRNVHVDAELLERAGEKLK